MSRQLNIAAAFCILALSAQALLGPGSARVGELVTAPATLSPASVMSAILPGLG